MSIERWTPKIKKSLTGPDMELRMWTDKDGDYVLYKDLAALREENDQLRSDKRELVEALNKISNPIFYLRKEAESSGGTLNGFAVQLSNDANYLKGIARTALAKHKECL